MFALMWISCQCFRLVGALLRPRATILLCPPRPPFTFTATMLVMHSVRVQQCQVDLWPEHAKVDRWRAQQRVEDPGCHFIHI